MRTSIFTRALMAVATAAIASGALAALPADAATASGITRESALFAIRGNVPTGPPPEHLYNEMRSATRDILERSCNLDSGEIVHHNVITQPVTTNRYADGMLAAGFVYDSSDELSRTCIIGVTATTFTSSTLNGTSTLSVEVLRDGEGTVTPITVASAQTGDVFVTGPISVPAADDVSRAMYASAGDWVNLVGVPATYFQPRSAAEKKAARKVYDKKVKTAKKACTKALKKAGSSKNKKTKAKKKYLKKKAAARSVYKKAIKAVPVSTTRPTPKRAYSISTPWVE